MTNRVCPDSWGPPVHGLRILHKCKCEYVERLWSSGSPSPSLYISEGVTRTSSWLSGLYDVMDHNNVFTGPGSQLGVRVERFREVHINTDVPAFTLPPLLNAPHTTWPTQPRKNIPFDPLRKQEACGRWPSTCFLYSEGIEVGSKKKLLALIAKGHYPTDSFLYDYCRLNPILPSYFKFYTTC